LLFKDRERYLGAISIKAKPCAIPSLGHPLSFAGKRGLYFFPVSRTASGESRQNMVAYAVAGALANLAEALGWSEQSGVKV